MAAPVTGPGAGESGDPGRDTPRPPGAPLGSADSAGTGSSGRHAAGDQHHGGWARFLKETAIVLVAALALSVLVRAFLVQAFYVPSASMEDTLLPSDRILASKITTHFTGVHRGEVVVFRDPGGWLPPPAPPPNGAAGFLRNALTFVGLLPSDSGQDLVKRVIGVGGDRVACCDAEGKIVLNGVPLTEPYIKPGDTTDQVRFDITVPAGGMFVMGDNRADSRDSRYHLEVNSGAVPVDDAVGRVVLVVWPFNRFTTVPIPDVPFGNPALERAPAGG